MGIGLHCHDCQTAQEVFHLVVAKGLSAFRSECKIFFPTLNTLLLLKWYFPRGGLRLKAAGTCHIQLSYCILRTASIGERKTKICINLFMRFKIKM